jgi:hypothetical protein
MTLTGLPFRQGDHVCALYSSPAEQQAIAASFIAAGLQAGERCLFAGYSDEDVAAFRAALREKGVDAEQHQADGALLLLTKEQAHLVDGRFDSERMLAMLNDAVEGALNDGYAGLRTCGDMTWLLDQAPGSEHVVEYEALVTQMFRGMRALAMCQYDRSRLPDRFVKSGLLTHATVLVNGAHRPNPAFAKDGLLT